MFRHRGKNRTYFHNIKLASLLSFVAGTVNIVGVLSIKILTTNITGHFAFFSEEVVLKDYYDAALYLLFIGCFLGGAFSSSLLVEFVSRFRKFQSHFIPLLIEIFILGFIGLFADFKIIISPNMIACLLLFAMGLQNSLVTRVSQSVVRTTHLTGIFTDLGIEMSKLFFYGNAISYSQLKKSIMLKIVIVLCFFSGGVIGGFTYEVFHIKTLLFSVGILLFVIWYDRLLYKYYVLKRKLR
ncbi:DUF1275 domain-containing protein [Chryseobacterium nematophagum]|uniref:DUF1275 domain-containing protein n=1 Tax=Chryseobacterium nematophagum TaxID=2305228 RepID=A0A3M7THH4_9FLAO|nr:YoaK family protein [Chryseobacterium nematophagum]RNA62981.1 DUF1275 domain-containing protein [Chryseobacterium nematophagum]